MYCKNCGSLIEDEDSRFCSDCGCEIIKSINTSSDVNICNDTPENDATPDSVSESAMFEVTPGVVPEVVPEVSKEAVNNTILSKECTQDNKEEKKKTRVPFIILTVIFTLISITSSVINIVYTVNNKNLYDNSSLNNYIIIFSSFIIAVFFVMIYSFSKNKILSVFKGIILIALLVSNILITGIRTFKDEIEFIKNSNSVSDVYLSVLIIAGFILLYIFIFTDGIKSLFCTKKITGFVSFIGYLSLLALITVSVMYIYFNNDTYLIFGKIPQYSYIIAFILADIFSCISWKRV